MTSKEHIDNLPLVERLKKAQYLARELSEHLTQAYLPKLSDLRLATKEFDPTEMSDQQVFDCTLATLNAEEFTDNLYEKLRIYLDSIRNEMEGMLFTNESEESTAIRQLRLDNIDGAGLFD